MRQLIKANGTRIPIEDGDRIVRINTVKRYRMHKIMPKWDAKLGRRAWNNGGFITWVRPVLSVQLQKSIDYMTLKDMELSSRLARGIG